MLINTIYHFVIDSDLNSEDGFNYEKMVQNFCSPIAANPRQEQPQQQKQPVDNAQSSKNQEQSILSFLLIFFYKIFSTDFSWFFIQRY